MLSVLAFLFVLGLLILVHEFGHFLAAKRTGVRVEKFSLGFGRRLLSRRSGDTEYSISAIPLGGYVKLAGDSREDSSGAPDEYLSKPIASRAAIIFSGPLLNYVLGVMVLWAIIFTGYPALTTKVAGVIDGFGAQEAGIVAGDKIVAIEGRPVLYWEELQKAVQEQKGKPSVAIVVLRNSVQETVRVRLKEQQIEDALGQKHTSVLLGVTPDLQEFIKVRHGFLGSLYFSVKKTLDLTLLTYRAIGRMLTGKMSMRDSVAGPLGIFQITSQAARVGLLALFHLIAVLSVSLAIFNLLPLPVLDGGHLMLLLVEKIRGRALGAKAERIINQAGLAFIVSLALFVTYNDILRMFGDKIGRLFR